MMANDTRPRQTSRVGDRRRSSSATECCDVVFVSFLILIGLSIVGTFAFLFVQVGTGSSLATAPTAPTASTNSQDLVDRILSLAEELDQLQTAVAAHHDKRDKYYQDRAAELAVLIPQNLSTRIRPDFRCGPNFLAPDGSGYGECAPSINRDPGGPCCRPDSGWCGNIRGKSWGHCDCPDCVDFVQVKEMRTKLSDRISQGHKSEL
eukprot:m.104318 g.104318  ORF g.104318 m.104318 type:complete len:206 (+) comp20932_c0_seq1:366-983(+)